MTEPAVRRPPMLTGACLYLGALSLIMAIRALTLVSSWNGEGRAADFAQPLQALEDGGMSASGAETFYKGLLTVVAVLAACGVVFAIHTARGHRPSRVGLTIAVGVAGLITFLGGLGGTFLFSMIGALAVVFSVRLWTGETRTYFRTLAGHAPPAPAAVPAAQAPAAPATRPDPFAPAAQEPPVQAWAQPPAGQPSAPFVHHGAAPRQPSLPRPVSIAAWTAFAGSLAVALGAAMGLLGLGLVGDDYEQMLRDSPFSESMLDQSSVDYDQLYRMSLAILGVCLPLALAGLVASLLVIARKRVGVFLFVMSSVTVVVSVLMFPVGLPWTAAAIVCLVQLRRPEAKAWFTAR